MSLLLRPATAADAPSLAAMNRQLIADEGSRNPMSLAELEERMRRLIAEGWAALLFEDERELAGYALYRVRHDEYDPQRPEVDIRQFFVLPERRGRGVGRAAFERMAAAHFPPGARLVLEVLASNPAGRAFWGRLGFTVYATTLTRASHEDTKTRRYEEK
ncbi:MAG TPA: GNAT family N-acetyltransferase [Roseiflexaceae bacterium]|nr:GNAT family N-acetyltransferase [Roseiflexaceae bacterium]